MHKCEALRVTEPLSSADGTSENGSELKPLDVGGRVRVSRLDSIVTVRAELGRVYREARRREGRYPNAQTGLRLANILGAISKSIELEDLSRRLEILEMRNASRS